MSNNTSQKHLVFTVINDLTTDQRMQRICTSLVNAGYTVTLIGRKLPHSKPLKERIFFQKRLNVWFKRGKMFYIEYNLRLFWHLLFTNYTVYGAIDLDTILPNFIVSQLKRRPMTYDAHEYFAELPEIIHRPLVRWFWKKLEQTIVPRLTYTYTINQTYAHLFQQQYGTHFAIVRNATVLTPLPPKVEPPTTRYILYQGAVNVGRGVEEMIEAMYYINDCQLYVCGTGDVYQHCIALSQKIGVADKVQFFGQIPPESLLQFTREATLGFTFFTNDGLSYYYSLANRFFDYIHSGIPQLAVNFPEYQRINEQYKVAILLDEIVPQNIAAAVNQLLQDKDLYNELHQNCLRARETYNWQEEEKTLINLYKSIST